MWVDQHFQCLRGVFCFGRSKLRSPVASLGHWGEAQCWNPSLGNGSEGRLRGWTWNIPTLGVYLLTKAVNVVEISWEDWRCNDFRSNIWSKWNEYRKIIYINRGWWNYQTNSTITTWKRTSFYPQRCKVLPFRPGRWDCRHRGREGQHVVAAGVSLQTIVLGEPILRNWSSRGFQRFGATHHGVHPQPCWP